MMMNGTLMSPLSNGLTLVKQSLGPFGAIDMVYVAVPVSVTRLVHDIVEMVRSSMGHDNVAARRTYFNITLAAPSLPIHMRWLQSNYYTYVRLLVRNFIKKSYCLGVLKCACV
ncbi:hypothetical protein THRCLA_22789, partial [Thraustotheca clavata]